jgi:hypothetical protein
MYIGKSMVKSLSHLELLNDIGLNEPPFIDFVEGKSPREFRRATLRMLRKRRELMANEITFTVVNSMCGETKNWADREVMGFCKHTIELIDEMIYRANANASRWAIKKLQPVAAQAFTGHFEIRWLTKLHAKRDMVYRMYGL